MILNRTIDCYCSAARVRVDLLRLRGGYRFRQLEASDFHSSPLGQEKKRAENYAVRLKEGHEAWGYVDKSDGIACYLWLTLASNATEIADFECGLKAEIPIRAGYIWDCRTHPAHQGRGLYRHGLQSLRDVAASRGASSVLIVTRRENKRSAASIAKVGFERVAVLRLHAFRGLVLLREAAGFKFLRTGSTVKLPDGN